MRGLSSLGSFDRRRRSVSRRRGKRGRRRRKRGRRSECRRGLGGRRSVVTEGCRLLSVPLLLRLLRGTVRGIGSTKRGRRVTVAGLLPSEALRRLGSETARLSAASETPIVRRLLLLRSAVGILGRGRRLVRGSRRRSVGVAGELHRVEGDRMAGGAVASPGLDLVSLLATRARLRRVRRASVTTLRTGARGSRGRTIRRSGGGGRPSEGARCNVARTRSNVTLLQRRLRSLGRLTPRVPRRRRRRTPRITRRRRRRTPRRRSGRCRLLRSKRRESVAATVAELVVVFGGRATLGAHAHRESIAFH